MVLFRDTPARRCDKFPTSCLINLARARSLRFSWRICDIRAAQLRISSMNIMICMAGRFSFIEIISIYQKNQRESSKRLGTISTLGKAESIIEKILILCAKLK